MPRRGPDSNATVKLMSNATANGGDKAPKSSKPAIWEVLSYMAAGAYVWQMGKWLVSAYWPEPERIEGRYTLPLAPREYEPVTLPGRRGPQGSPGRAGPPGPPGIPGPPGRGPLTLPKPEPRERPNPDGLDDVGDRFSMLEMEE